VINRGFAHRIPEAGNGRNGWFESARQDHCTALTAPLISYAMEFADAASSAFGIEARYPFFDQRLVEFCVSIPAGQKLRNGWTRAVMRRAMEGILPRAVQWRVDKADLSFNFKRRLFERDRATIQELLKSRLGCLEEYVDVQAVQDAYRRWSEQPMQREKDALTLYTVATLALWLGKSANIFSDAA
jgi:asparagine synthase (glutamine-hydrolysing)